MASARFLTGLLAGVAAGTFVSLLFTTEKGAEIRSSAQKKGKDYVEDLKNSFDNFVDAMGEKYSQAKEDAINKAKEAWEK